MSLRSNKVIKGNQTANTQTKGNQGQNVNVSKGGDRGDNKHKCPKGVTTC